MFTKYPNRKIYNTETSNYATLADVLAAYVLDNTVKVVKSDTGEDITRDIVVQAAAKNPYFANLIFELVY